MSSTPDFVSELYRAANERAKLSLPERCRLIERALAALADQLETLASRGIIAPVPAASLTEVRTSAVGKRR
jgi:predicted transcriptional regulator